MDNCHQLTADRIVRRVQMSPRDLAHLHALRAEAIQGDDIITFLLIFDKVRDAELHHVDSYKTWRTMLDDPDGALATAAYLEAVASTRRAA